jgi:choline dehydrogenase-like flavoprotein
MQRYRATLASAHVMGGCNMSADAATGVVDPQGQHQQLHNLTICDGSILPSSLGANPQLTIYALSWRICTDLIKKLSV